MLGKSLLREKNLLFLMMSKLAKLVRPCETGKFTLRPYQNNYGN